MTDYKKYDVNGDETPITHQPIEQINAEQWNELSTGELIRQYNSLQNRINLLLSMGRSDMAKQMQQGLLLLNTIINSRSQKEEKLI